MHQKRYLNPQLSSPKIPLTRKTRKSTGHLLVLLDSEANNPSFCLFVWLCLFVCLLIVCLFVCGCDRVLRLWLNPTITFKFFCCLHLQSHSESHSSIMVLIKMGLVWVLFWRMLNKFWDSIDGTGFYLSIPGKTQSSFLFFSCPISTKYLLSVYWQYLPNPESFIGMRLHVHVLSKLIIQATYIKINWLHKHHILNYWQVFEFIDKVGFLWVMENLESHGILEFYFSCLASHES